MPSANSNTQTVNGGEIRVGDLLRFRMSKHEPVRWLRVLNLTPSGTGRRVRIALENGCADTVSKRETRQIIREVAL